MTKMRLVSALTILSVCLPVFAQKEDEAAKEKMRQRILLSEAIIADSRELRLPENRAIVFAKTGSRLWASDQKRAQDLFEDSINELLAAQAEAEMERRQGRQNELLTGQTTRPQVMQTIAAHNADFALRSLYRTRPTAVERAMVNQTVKDSKIRGTPGSDTYLVQNELNLEQSLLRLAADQNPEKAIALLQAALKKGVTGEALNLLRKLHEKDPAAAAELGSEVTAQLMRKNFMIGTQPDYSAMQASFSFLNEHLRQRPATDKGFRFTAADMKSLADKLIAFLLERGNQYGYPYAQQMVQVAEKMRPDAVEKLKELGVNSRRQGFSSIQQDPNLSRLMKQETPIEQVLAEAPKLPADTRRQVYHSAANRLVAAGDLARARQVINDNFSDEALTNAEESLNWYYSHQLINQGKFTEAEALIDEFPEGNRLSALISLANAMFSRDAAENKTRALGVLEKARAGLPPRPENNNEMQHTMQLIAAYTRIEPAEAFRMLEGMVPQINELAEASVVISGFQGNNNIRRGELVISNGVSLGAHVDLSIIRVLAQKDFDRTMGLIGTFARREMRVSLKQQLLETL